MAPEYRQGCKHGECPVDGNLRVPQECMRWWSPDVEIQSKGNTRFAGLDRREVAARELDRLAELGKKMRYLVG